MGVQLSEYQPGYCLRSTEDAVASVGLPGPKAGAAVPNAGLAAPRGKTCARAPL